MYLSYFFRKSTQYVCGAGIGSSIYLFIYIYIQKLLLMIRMDQTAKVPQWLGVRLEYDKLWVLS